MEDLDVKLHGGFSTIDGMIYAVLTKLEVGSCHFGNVVSHFVSVANCIRQTRYTPSNGYV